MSVTSIYNPSPNIIGPELMPVKSGIMTVDAGKGIVMAFKTINAFACSKILLPILSFSSNARMNVEILSALTPTPSTLTTNTFVPTANGFFTVAVQDTTAGTVNPYLSIDDNSGDTASWITNSNDAYSGTSEGKLTMTSSPVSLSGRMKRVGIRVWAGIDPNSTSKAYKTKIVLAPSSTQLVELGDFALGDFNLANESTIWNQIDPFTSKPFLAGSGLLASPSGNFGVEIIAQSSSVVRVFDTTLVTELYTTNKMNYNDTFSSIGNNTLDSTLPQWKDLSLATTVDGTSLNLAATTTYYLHISALTGSFQIPYQIYGSYPTTNSRVLYISTLDGANGIIKTTQEIGKGHIPFILESSAFSIGSASATSNIGTVTTTAAHNLSAGQTVRIQSASISGYNTDGATVLTTPSTTKFTYFATTPISAQTSAVGSVYPFEPNSYSGLRLLDNNTAKDNTNGSANAYPLPIMNIYTAVGGDQFYYTTNGSIAKGVKFPVKWQSSIRPDSTLQIQIRSAINGAGTLYAEAVLSPNTNNINSQNFTIVQVPFDVSYTTLGEGIHIWFTSSSTSGNGWVVAVEDSFSATNYLPVTTNFGVLSIKKNLYTQIDVESAGAEGRLNAYNGVTYSAGVAFYNVPVQFLYSPAPPKGLTVSAVASTSNTRV